LSSARRAPAKRPARAPRGRPLAPARRLRILYLTSAIPFPPDSGAAIKSLSVLDHLRRHHDVRTACFRRTPLTEEQAAWAGDSVATIELNRQRNAWNLVRSYISRVPLGIERNRSGDMKRLVEAEVAAFAPQAIVVDGWLMPQYVPQSYTGQRLLHEHNAEYTLWERQTEEEKGLRKLFVSREAGRVRRYERELLKRFDIVFAVSEDDRRALEQLDPEGGAIRLLPNLPEPSLLERPSPAFDLTEPAVLYFGTLSWEPNIEGLNRFLANVWPGIRKRMPDASLLVAGKGGSPDLASRVAAAENAEFIGDVGDPESVYAQARVVVDAARTGGGTRIKILNSLARGIPVVATVQAARGLDIVPGEHLISVRTDGAMADAVASLLKDPVRWKVISENGRALIRARYVPTVAFRELDDALAAALGD
jgi:glycosyltransferase involved in cell wall biosynthesis